MHTDYNLIARTRGDMSFGQAERLLDVLETWSPAVGWTEDQHPEFIITVRATSLVDAVERGTRALTDPDIGDLSHLEVMTTVEFDRLYGLDPA